MSFTSWAPSEQRSSELWGHPHAYRDIVGVHVDGESVDVQHLDRGLECVGWGLTEPDHLGIDEDEGRPAAARVPVADAVVCIWADRQGALLGVVHKQLRHRTHLNLEVALEGNRTLRRRPR